MSWVQGGRSPWWVGPPLRLTKPGAIPGWAFLAPKLGRIPPPGQEPGCSLRPLLATWHCPSALSPVHVGKPRQRNLPRVTQLVGPGLLFMKPSTGINRSWGGVQMGRRWGWVPPPWLVSWSASARQGCSRAGLLGSGSYLAVPRGLSESGGGRTRGLAWFLSQWQRTQAIGRCLQRSPSLGPPPNLP